MVLRSKVITAFRRSKPAVYPVHQLPRPVQPAGLSGGLIQVQQPLRQKGVVVQIGGVFGPAPGITAQQFTALIGEGGQQEVSRTGGHLRIVVIVQHLTGSGKGADGQAVPCGDDLVVPIRGDASAAVGQQQGAGVGQRGQHVRLAHMKFFNDIRQRLRSPQHVFALKVALFGHPVGGTEQGRGALAAIRISGSEHLFNLTGTPDKKLALHPFAVRILRRIKAPLRRHHLALQIGQTVPRHGGELLATSRPVGIQIERD